MSVLAELCEVLSREQFRRYIDEEDIRNFVAVLTREAEWVEVNVRITACRDPKDDKFLELAVSGLGTCIVSGDSDLLALNPFQGIAILTPQEFLKEQSASQSFGGSVLKFPAARLEKGIRREGEDEN